MKNYSLKTILLITFSVAYLFSTAQSKKLTLGVKGGINMSTFRESNHTKSKPGVVAGLTADYRIKNNLYVISGLSYVVKGTKVDGGEGNGDGVDLNYIQLPFHLGYKYELTPDFRLVAEIGPYLAYGISGKIKYKAIGNYEAYEVDAFDDDVYKSFDAGLGFGAGVEISRLSLKLGYDYGLSKINDFQSIVNIENSSISITAGFKF